MRISSTVDIFKLGVGNYKVQKKKTYEMPSNTTYILLTNSLFVEQIIEAGQKVDNSN